MTRQFWVLAHRYAGLAMTAFLVIVGLTGSVLAFREELDVWLNPELLTVSPRAAPMLDPFVLRDTATALYPNANVDFVQLHVEPGRSASFAFQLRPDDENSPAIELFLDPYTGEKLGARTIGEFSLTKQNIISFLYRLHYSLALPAITGSFGGYLLGVIALVWTIDCFIGFYLTFPASRKSAHSDANHRSWWSRWNPAWLVKRKRLNFDLHRAGGLWVWPMLLIFAWSSVAFNLNEVYTPVMKLAFDMQEPMADMPKLDKPVEKPALGWREAYARGRELMTEASARKGFTVEKEQFVVLARQQGVYTFMVRGSKDISKRGGTMVTVDANNGALKSFSIPGERSSGQTITEWLVWLHMAQVFGLPMQIFVCVMGLMIVMLSITGVIIWLKKRRARRLRVKG
jgi:uncharacterized iron-regulated membrane protein